MKLAEELVPIGGFARLSGLTVKALRHYDEIGLLKPAQVDGSSGYRYYALEQARDAEAIRRLRSLELPLEEIRIVLEADDAEVKERLVVHRARLEGQLVGTRRIIDELDRLIDGKESIVSEIDLAALELKVVDVPARRVAFVRERAHMNEMPKVVPAGIGRVAHAVGMKHDGPPFCRCPAPDADGFFDVQIGWPVPEDVEAEPPVEISTYETTRALVAKHVGPYDRLGNTYRAMAEVMEQQGLQSAGAPIEWYESDPDEVPDPEDYLTIIEWPVEA